MSLKQIFNRKQKILLLVVSYAACIGMAVGENTAEEPHSQDASKVEEELEEIEEELEEIVVYGTNYSETLRKALTAKRNADSVIEALSAEDIGKLPDVSIAESLSRLPGLSSERNPAGASFISIRGMGAILSNATLNGREVTTSEQTRSIDYSQFPTELITGAWVYKTPTASLIEGGVAGTIELKAVRPLDYDQRVISVAARARYNDLASDLPDSDTTGYRGSLSYIDQFNDGALGIVLGYARQVNPLVSADSSIYSSRTVSSGGTITGIPGDNDFNIPYGADHSITVGESTRDGYLAALQWRANDNFELNIDAMYSRFDITTNERALRVNGYGSSGNNFSDVVADGFNLLSATVSCNQPVNGCNRGFGQDLSAINAHYEEVNDLFNGGISATWVNDQWAFSTDLAYSTASLDNFYGAVSTKPYSLGTTEEINPVSVFGVSSSGAAFLTSPNDFADPDSNLITQHQVPTDHEVQDDLSAWKIDGERFLNNRWFTSVKIGIRYLDRSKAISIRMPANTTLNEPVAIPATLIEGIIDQDSSDADFLTNPILALDVQAVVERFFPDSQSSAPVCMTCSSDVSEQTWAGYFQANFAISLGNIPVSGNIGIRVAETEVNTAGFQDTSEVTGIVRLTPTSTSNKDTYVLPSLNIAVLPTGNTVIRLALARTIARPPINFYNPGLSQSLARDGLSVTAFDAGNPFLDPYEANQVDLTFEKYFSENTALTLSLFYKDLDTFITNVRLPAPSVILTTGVSVDGFVIQPVNGNGGYIRGVEILWQHSFTAFPAPFNNLGVYVNYSYTESNISFSEAFSSSEYGLDGLSRDVGNLTFWYSQGQFDARVSYYFRSEFTRPQRAGGAFITNDDGGDLSFRISWTMDDLAIALQGYNLTDDARDSFYGNPKQRGQYRKFGRNYELAVSYKF